MARITLMRREIDSAIDVAGQIGVHLNDAVEIALVPIVTAPWFIGHVFHREILVRRKGEMRLRPGPTFLDRQLEDGVEFVLGNDEGLPPLLVALPERTATRDLCFELFNDLVKVRVRISGRYGVVKRFRFVVEL